MAEALLETRDLCKSYGGLVVTDAVSLVVASGEIHAIIGPNGAGKTTLIAELAGELRPDSGSICFAGADITRLAMAQRAAIGIARSFQITSIFREFSVLDNVAMAAQAHAGHSFRFWRSARRDARLRDPARQVLAKVGLAERAESRAAALSHGEKRALEIAMVLATRPRLLLLDEPMAGMGPQDAAGMVRLLAELKRQVAMVLVEHDMDAVFALADRITVMVYGRIIASGTPDAIRGDAEVRRAYLGEGAA
jgi:branched-chain amino acid transport system ATP-binding protein